ncbi:phosphate ABC transporter permease [bacterium SM23_57]|nr:MAG: phosphate ABC transporter permease [bacterium SM23_57]
MLTRRVIDRLAQQVMGTMAITTGLLVPVIILALCLRARPILEVQSLSELIFSREWHPLRGLFGFYPFIVGTFWVTAVGMVIAVPPSLLTAIYLAEYAHPKTRALVKPFVDLLAGIPSVVYGVWGILTVVPFIEKTIAPAVKSRLGILPLFQTENPTGYGILAGGVVLAVMVFPIIIAVAEEVISAVPQGLREASLALGATRWQTIRRVVLRRGGPGVLAAVVLGFSRAFGETMAVLMVVGNVPQVPRSIFDAAYPLTALIANNYGEMMSIPQYDAALLGAALILMIVVLFFNLGSRLILVRIGKNE